MPEVIRDLIGSRKNTYAKRLEIQQCATYVHSFNWMLAATCFKVRY